MSTKIGVLASESLKVRLSHNNDNVTSRNEVNNDNDIGKITQKSVGSSAKSRAVENIAQRLVDAFNNPGAREYYCKVAWSLSEATIWNNVELAKSKGRSPAKYFTWLCGRAMQ